MTFAVRGCSSPTVLRATEAYTTQLPGERRRFLPLYSLMIATEPLPAETWEQLGWSGRDVVPHGGHQMSLHLAAGLGLGGNESYPGIFQPFGGFADGVPVEEGYVRLPDAPGIGFEAKAELFGVMREIA